MGTKYFHRFIATTDAYFWRLSALGTLGGDRNPGYFFACCWRLFGQHIWQPCAVVRVYSRRRRWQLKSSIIAMLAVGQKSRECNTNLKLPDSCYNSPPRWSHLTLSEVGKLRAAVRDELPRGGHTGSDRRPHHSLREKKYITKNISHLRIHCLPMRGFDNGLT